MGIPLWAGPWIFLLVPTLLWLGCSLLSRRGPTLLRLATLFGGGDGRLSLSKLQALLWTLVIIGAYAGAMAVHERIRVDPPEVGQAVASSAARSRAAAELAEALADTALARIAIAAVQLTLATDRTAKLETRLKRMGELKFPAESLRATQQQLDNARLEHGVSQVDYDGAARDSVLRVQLARQRRAQADSLTRVENQHSWVRIPGALLALAGISLGAGVFSTLIAAANREGTATTITWIERLDDRNVRLSGAGFGSETRVRLDRAVVAVCTSNAEGTTMDLRLSAGSSGLLVVDAPGGRVTRGLSWSNDTPVLGDGRVYFEFADLFRDDKNPRQLDIMKFQMFCWTMVGLGIYVIMVWQNLHRADLTTLPVVDDTVVTLTGLSQAGYLGGKVASNSGRT